MRLLALGALAALVCAALGAAVVSAWAVGRGPAGRPTTTRTDAPLALGGGTPPAVRVRIEPVEAAPLDRRVVVENPNARPVSGLRATTRVDGGSCQWVDGPFPAPFGLAAGTGTARTCRLAVEGPGAATVEVAVDAGGRRVGSAVETVAAPVPPPTTTGSTTPPVPPTQPSDRPAPPAATPHPPATPTTAATCPRLVDGLHLDPAGTLDRLGGALTDRVRLLALDGCPEWAAVASLRLDRAATGDPCPPWELHLDGPGTVTGDPTPPVARLTGPQQPGCPALPLEVEVSGGGGDLAPVLAALASWSVGGPGARPAELHRAAVTGTGSACVDGSPIALGQAHLHHAGDQRTYRVRVLPC
jgi:hypothetical protein